MLIERQLPIFIIGTTILILVPPILLGSGAVESGTAMIFAAVIGPLGIFMGCGGAYSYSSRKSRNVRLIIWGLLAIGMSVCLGAHGLLALETWHRLLFFGSACLPPAAYITAFILYKESE